MAKPVEESEAPEVADVIRETRAELAALGPDDLSMDGGEEQEGEAEETSSEVAEPESTPESDTAGEETPEEGEESSPEPETPESEQQATAEEDDTPPQDPDHFWGQYKDDDARKRGLYETKVYAAKVAKQAREAQAKLAEREAEIERLRTGQPPASVPQPSTETSVAPRKTLADTIQALADEDPKVRQEVDSVLDIRAKREGLVAQGKEIEKRVAELDTEILKVEAIIAYNESWAKDNPESEEFRNEIAKHQQKRLGLETERNRLDLQYQRAEVTHFRLGQQYDVLEASLRGKAAEFDKRGEKQAEEERAYSQSVEDTQKEWAASLDRYCAMHGIADKDEREDVNDLLQKEAYPVIDEIEDFYDFMTGPAGDRALRVIQRAQKRAVAKYSADKRRDATQTNGNPPTPKKTTEDEERPAPESIEDLIRTTRAQLVGSLRGPG